MPAAGWSEKARADRWIERREALPGQAEVARVVFQDVIAGQQLSRILDLGTGDGRVIAGLRAAFPMAELYREAFELVAPGGVFCNVDLVALPTAELFERAMRTYGLGPDDEDDTDQPAPVEAQLTWLRTAGFANVDCC